MHQYYIGSGRALESRNKDILHSQLRCASCTKANRAAFISPSPATNSSGLSCTKRSFSTLMRPLRVRPPGAASSASVSSTVIFFSSPKRSSSPPLRDQHSSVLLLVSAWGHPFSFSFPLVLKALGCWGKSAKGSGGRALMCNIL